MKILGYTDGKNECDCGKTGLKGVYIVETFEGTVLNLGSSCVKKNWDLTQTEFTSKVNEAKENRRNERDEFMREANNAFNSVVKQYPEANKYTPEAIGYNEFMIAFNNLKTKRAECDKALPLIYTK